MGEDKVRENRLRRQAKRLDLSLVKSRAKRWSGQNKQGYMILDPYRNFILWGPNFDLDLDDVEELLNEYEEKQKAGK